MHTILLNFFTGSVRRTKAVTQKTLRLFNVERVKGALQLQGVFISGELFAFVLYYKLNGIINNYIC